MWVYLLSDDGSDIELQDWEAGAAKYAMDIEDKWVSRGYPRKYFTVLEDAKTEGIKRQLKACEQIKENIENLNALTPTGLKQEYLR